MTDETNKPEEEMSEDELIDAALAALDGELPTTPEEPEEDAELTTAEPQQAESEAVSLDAGNPQSQAPQQAVEMTPEMLAAMSSTSPTLQALEENRRPSQKTVCERCPHSVWFASPEEVKCYCRVMFLVSWSTKEPNQITNCDGEFLGQEE